MFFLTGVPSYGLSLWLPQIVKSFGVSHIVTGLLSALPFVFGCIAMVYWGRRSDERGERQWHATVPAVVGGAALIVGALLTSERHATTSPSVLPRAGIYALKGPFLTIVSEPFSDKARGGGHRGRDDLGNLSGFVGALHGGRIIEATEGSPGAWLRLASSHSSVRSCCWAAVQGTGQRSDATCLSSVAQPSVAGVRIEQAMPLYRLREAGQLVGRIQDLERQIARVELREATVNRRDPSGPDDVLGQRIEVHGQHFHAAGDTELREKPFILHRDAPATELQHHVPDARGTALGQRVADQPDSRSTRRRHSGRCRDPRWDAFPRDTLAA